MLLQSIQWRTINLLQLNLTRVNKHWFDLHEQNNFFDFGFFSVSQHECFNWLDCFFEVFFTFSHVLLYKEISQCPINVHVLDRGDSLRQYMEQGDFLEVGCVSYSSRIFSLSSSFKLLNGFGEDLSSRSKTWFIDRLIKVYKLIKQFVI